jgi:hypothetical protein
MAGREPGPDPDDWFDEPRVPPELRPRAPLEQDQTAVLDDWLTSDDTQGGRRFRIGDFELTARQAAFAAGAAALILLLVGLAAGGVFSGGSAAPTAETSSPPSTTASTGPGASTGPAPAVQGPTATLKPGDTGTQVKALQRALTKLGYSPGKADGAYGPGTQKALAAFQKANSLTADGILGSQTLAALTSALMHAG